MMDMLMFSIVEVANGEYSHVKKWSIVGYAHVH